MIGLFSISLRALESAALPPHLGELAHALLFDLLRSEDPALSAAVHGANPKPFSLAVHAPPAKDGRIALSKGDIVRLTVGTLDAPLTRCLCTALALARSEKRPLRLGEGGFACSHVTYRAADFADLAMPVSAKAVFLADFRTPTAFKMGDVYYPFPEPGLFFSSLLRRWNAFCPDEKLPDVSPEEWRSSVWLSRFRGRTKPFLMKGGRIPGFTGQLWLELADPQRARTAARLLAFAPFAGAGVKTAMGMGQVRVASARQPRP